MKIAHNWQFFGVRVTPDAIMLREDPKLSNFVACIK